MDFIDRKKLVDIRIVAVDKELSREERLLEFVRQIKNPYLFKYKKYVVRTRYSKSGPSFEDCLRGMVVN